MKGTEALQKLFYKSTSYLKKNSSTILTVVGAIGVVTTAVFAARDSEIAKLRIDAAENEKGEELTKLETAIAAAPAYIPTIAAGTSTIICIFGANVLNKRKQAALASAYALVNSTHKKYTDKVKELLGEKTDVRIRDAIAKDRRDEDVVAYAPGLWPGDLSGDKLLFYDEYGDRYFEASMNEVLNAEYHLNRNFALKGCINVNEFYDFLGLERASFGDAVGWSGDEFIEGGLTPWIDFDHRATTIEDGSEEGLECIVIRYDYGPTTGYDQYC